MNDRSQSPLSAVVCLVISCFVSLVIGGVVGFDCGGVIGSVIGGVIGDIVGFAFGGLVIFVFSVINDPARVQQLGRGSQAPAIRQTAPSLASTSLRWVRGFLPRDEGVAWWADVLSCLAETPDKNERRRYVRSYLRRAPWLIWTTWSLRFRAARQRKLS